ncbi:hypothetical protein DQ04_02201000, partial [Trypanosoma grayi]|uniref:hypothetical protein n=1 Tax=Trypanosoma grayi TaxID=71804 RepID=UPI0004F49335
GTVSCSGCCSKLGTAGDDVCCPCGCAVAGRTARLAASKVEAPLRQEVSGDLESLLVQAAREREELLQEQLGAARRGECSESDDGDERRKKEPKKNVKANNRSNFTHFRNKNFAPRLPSHGGTLDSGNGDKDRQSNDEDEYETHEELTQQTGRRKNKRKGARRKDDEATATQPAGTP